MPNVICNKSDSLQRKSIFREIAFVDVDLPSLNPSDFGTVQAEFERVMTFQACEVENSALRYRLSHSVLSGLQQSPKPMIRRRTASVSSVRQFDCHGGPPSVLFGKLSCLRVNHCSHQASLSVWLLLDG